MKEKERGERPPILHFEYITPKFKHSVKCKRTSYCDKKKCTLYKYLYLVFVEVFVLTLFLI